MTKCRLTTIVATFALSAIATSGVKAQPINMGGMGDSLFQVQPGRGARVSSSDPNWRNGNNDKREINPGGTLTIADIEGPGIIRHIWFTISASDPHYGRTLVLRMYWDNQEEPAVECPLGDFFAVGHGLRRSVDSIPVSVTSDGRAYNCYWPMPFAKRARITLTNDGKAIDQKQDGKIRSTYYYVDYEKVPALPANTAYFHAQYRQEYPATMGKNYLICDTEGEGQYVGTVLSAYSRTKGWFGEGDDFFYIDGETEPSLRGTGTEDYFCDAWGFREFCRPYYGVVIMDGYEVGARVSVYRWHIPDPVRFSKSLKLEIEHKGNMYDEKGADTTGYTERPDMLSSVAFWYQTGKAKRFATIPPVEQRLIPQTIVGLQSRIKDVQCEPAGLRIQLRESAKRGDLVVVTNKQIGTKVTVPFTLEKEVSGIARFVFGTLPEGGLWSVALDGKPVNALFAVDTFAQEAGIKEVKLGLIHLAPGEHSMTFECKGRNSQSTDYCLAAGRLVIDQVTPFYGK